MKTRDDALELLHAHRRLLVRRLVPDDDHLAREEVVGDPNDRAEGVKKFSNELPRRDRHSSSTT